MTGPRGADESRSSTELGIVLVCESCDHIWEPSLAELGAGPVLCTQCQGWTMIAELAITDQETSLRESAQ